MLDIVIFSFEQLVEPALRVDLGILKLWGHRTNRNTMTILRIFCSLGGTVTHYVKLVRL